jgi:hypothetical protein
MRFRAFGSCRPTGRVGLPADDLCRCSPATPRCACEPVVVGSCSLPYVTLPVRCDRSRRALPRSSCGLDCTAACVGGFTCGRCKLRSEERRCGRRPAQPTVVGNVWHVRRACRRCDPRRSRAPCCQCAMAPNAACEHERPCGLSRSGRHVNCRPRTPRGKADASAPRTTTAVRGADLRCGPSSCECAGRGAVYNGSPSSGRDGGLTTYQVRNVRSFTT